MKINQRIPSTLFKLKEENCDTDIMSEKYHSVPISDPDDENSSDRFFPRSGQSGRRKTQLTLSLIGALLVVVSIGFVSGYFIHDLSTKDRKSETELQSLGNFVDFGALADSTKASSSKTSKTPCVDPTIRREWRSLSRDEKRDYVSAVKCLMTTDSFLRKNGSLYDDFAWVHNRMSHDTHGSALFFSWHRQFINTYERTLRKYCQYAGPMPFWDWTLDWEHLKSSPVWSSTEGFGGNGDSNSPETVGHGRCVTDGPFSDAEFLFYASHDHPHCLSRGFTNFSGEGIQPKAIEAVMMMSQYEEFYLAVENGPHDVIPQVVRGDFWSFTAPNDPVFYLHHAQLDRLWWLWQQRGLPRRLTEYHGEASMSSTDAATLQDWLDLGALTNPVQVSDIINTEGGYLCYRY